MRKEVNDIIVRSAQIEDIDTLAKWWASGKVMAHAGFPNGIKTDKEQIKSDIIRCHETKFPRFERLMITLKPNQNIGEMSYRMVKPNIYEIGIKICEFDLHNKGYGTLAIKALLDYLFNDCKALKVLLDTNLDNVGAQNFYERLGFDKVMIRKDAFKNQLGELQSTVEYEMDKEKFLLL